MAPYTKKRKSNEMADVEPEASQDVTTPNQSPARKKLRITQAQKQALIDNLQLEITERARSLRAHYALQATDLRSRIERRINRIPMSLRSATMGELLDKSLLPVQPSSRTQVGASSKAHPLPPLPQDRTRTATSPSRPVPRAAKRGSNDMSNEASDKENSQPNSAANALPNPKNPKRVKATTTAAASTRTTSRAAKAAPSTVLSPKSHNPRTLPRSPVKEETNQPASPSKSHTYLNRPTSPLKPASPLKTAASAATSAISASFAGIVEHAKRGTANTVARARTASKEKAAALTAGRKKATAASAMPPPPRPAVDRTASQASNHSVVSNSSNSTNATTVITKKTTRLTKTNPNTKTTTTAKRAPTAATKTTAARAAATRTTAAAAKKAVAAESAAATRSLRKRA